MRRSTTGSACIPRQQQQQNVDRARDSTPVYAQKHNVVMNLAVVFGNHLGFRCHLNLVACFESAACPLASCNCIGADKGYSNLYGSKTWHQPGPQPSHDASFVLIPIYHHNVTFGVRMSKLDNNSSDINQNKENLHLVDARHFLMVQIHTHERDYEGWIYRKRWN